MIKIDGVEQYVKEAFPELRLYVAAKRGQPNVVAILGNIGYCANVSLDKDIAEVKKQLLKSLRSVAALVGESIRELEGVDGEGETQTQDTGSVHKD